MNAKALDVLVFIPLIPALPVAATWFLPWERWIARKIPRSILGPYLIYCSFAVWHFKFHLWFVAFVAFWGISLTTAAAWSARRSRLALSWPIADGRISQIDSRNKSGSWDVRLTYTYNVDHDCYAGQQSFEFFNDADAKRFEARYRERPVKVHYRPDKPDDSLLAREKT